MALYEDTMIGELFGVVEAAFPVLKASVPDLPFRVLGLIFGYPMSEPRLPILIFTPNFVLKFRYFAFDALDLSQLGIGVDPGLGFVGVIEKREQAKVFLVGNRIVLVRMALGALQG